MTRKQLGGIIFLVALGVSIIQTGYFGWNFFAQTPAEGVWDAICAFEGGVGIGMRI